jgi:hypothetical protein
MVDLLAPGDEIRSSVVTSKGAFALQSGTSMATPHVAGAWAVMKQQKPTASVAQVLGALQNTGKSVTDRRNGLVKKRIQLTAAVNTWTTSTNPVPILTSISPTRSEAGYPAFTLTVTGSNFVPTSVVRWKGVARPTTYVSATQLRAAISAADIAVAGTAPVTVFSPTPGGGTSAAATFTIDPVATAPMPTVTSLTPASRAAGSTAFTLIVKGTNFVPRSVVRWAGVARTTTYVSATELRAAISAADIATQAVKAVSVTTAAPGGGTSNAVNFTVTAAAPCSLDEPNNTTTTAKPFATGTTRKYGICTIGDKDYIKIEGIPGSTHTIAALSPAAALDLVIEAFDGAELLFEEDSGAEGEPEAVTLTLGDSGVVFIAFSEYGNDQGSSTFMYTVRVTSP